MLEQKNKLLWVPIHVLPCMIRFDFVIRKFVKFHVFFFFLLDSLFFISQLRETQSKLKQESTLQYNDEEAQLQMRFRRIMVRSVMLTNDRENDNVT